MVQAYSTVPEGRWPEKFIVVARGKREKPHQTRPALTWKVYIKPPTTESDTQELARSGPEQPKAMETDKEIGRRERRRRSLEFMN